MQDFHGLEFIGEHFIIKNICINEMAYIDSDL